ncbi:MAG: glycosyltransferase family 4 protein [Metallosphaera sp.]
MSRLLIVSERWWPDGTGGVLASHLIAGLLQDMGFRLTVVHGTREPLRLNGVRYVYSSLLSVRDKHRLWLNCSILAREHWFRKLISRSDVVYIPRLCYPLVPVVKGLGKRVIVHLHDYQPISYNAVVLKNDDRIIPKGFLDAVKLEVLQHGSILRALGAMTAPLNSFCRLWLKDADAIICVSKRQAELISKLVPELASKLKVIYNPLPDIPFVEKEISSPTFLYLGGDSYFKGFDIFLKASQEILKKGYPANFLLAGTFKKRGSKSAISVLNKKFNGVFNLWGYIPYKEVSRLHSRSCALLFPSICEEPLPYAVMESMVMGTMPVASRVGGVPEIVGGTFAERLMYKPNDVSELTEQIEYVLSISREQLTNISLSLRENVLKRFNRESVKEELVKAFLG